MRGLYWHTPRNRFPFVVFSGLLFACYASGLGEFIKTLSELQNLSYKRCFVHDFLSKDTLYIMQCNTSQSRCYLDFFSLVMHSLYSMFGCLLFSFFSVRLPRDTIAFPNKCQFSKHSTGYREIIPISRSSACGIPFL